MATARILRPAKTAMSSGTANTKKWVLEFEQASRRQAEPLMGWISAADTLNQIRLRFDTLDEAKAYADKHGLDYSIEEPHGRTLKPKAYADNFKYDRIR
ncbi:MAG TPA: ETC complex I subunit [Stellaceae bacterium]|nr:ETC complex I subunit [Stellaceae bacterium]